MSTLNSKFERSNEEWLSGLRSGQDLATADLRGFLLRGLARAFPTRHGLTPADLEDLVQESMIRILQGLDSFRGDSRFTTWAMAVAVRTAMGEVRRRRTRQDSLEKLVSDLSDSAAAGVDTGERAAKEAVLEALRQTIHSQLTERQRMVILGELSGLASAQLAERLGTNPNALYKLHHDARMKLKRALNAAGFSDQDVREVIQETSRSS